MRLNINVIPIPVPNPCKARPTIMMEKLGVANAKIVPDVNRMREAFKIVFSLTFCCKVALTVIDSATAKR